MQPLTLADELRVTLTGTEVAGLALDVTTPAGTAAYGVSSGATPFDLGPFKRKDFAWSLMLRNRDGSALGSPHELAGCPRAPVTIDLGEGHGLVIEPR